MCQTSHSLSHTARIATLMFISHSKRRPTMSLITIIIIIDEQFEFSTPSIIIFIHTKLSLFVCVSVRYHFSAGYNPISRWLNVQWYSSFPAYIKVTSYTKTKRINTLFAHWKCSAWQNISCDIENANHRISNANSMMKNLNFDFSPQQTVLFVSKRKAKIYE